MKKEIGIVTINSSEFCMSINILCDKYHLASIEISKIPDEDNWYFNRLIVPKEFRHQGYATKLLCELEKIADEKAMNIVLDINPYGDLNHEQLHNLYMKHGFINHDKYEMIRSYK